MRDRQRNNENNFDIATRVLKYRKFYLPLHFSIKQESIS